MVLALLKRAAGFGDPADDARKSYDVAIETKRRRGDRHFRKPALAPAE